MRRIDRNEQDRKAVLLYTDSERATMSSYIAFFDTENRLKFKNEKRSLENFTQLKTGIISVFENAIKLPADALIVLVDTIRRPKNFLIVFFDEKDKNKSVFKQKMAFQHKMKYKTKRFFERNEKRTWEIREEKSRRYSSVS